MATVQNGKLFSCGNHSVETTKGMLHFGDPSEVICMLGIPTTMTARDVIQFLNPSMPEIENTRIVREVNLDSSYIVILTFRNRNSAHEFYSNYDGVPYNSLEEHICRLLYITRIETFSEDPVKLKEISNCAVCLDRMYPDDESIITILCNHSFHVFCLNQWSDTTCPVCRYNQTPENQIESKCMDCTYEGESLWMCIVCGHVACGRYINGHAYDHFSQTQHTYAMQLTDNQVWDYAGDNYVHRLLANKTDGKPVEVEGTDAYRQAEEKIEAVQMEYTYLLTQQLDSQRKYYERLLRDSEKQSQKKVDDVESKNKKLLEELADVQTKHNQAIKDKNCTDKKLQKTKKMLAQQQSSLNDEKQMNDCLRANQNQFQEKLKALEDKLVERQQRIVEMEEQQRDLMFYLEARDKIDTSVNDQVVSRTEMNESQIVMEPSPSTSKQTASAARNNRRNRR